MEGALALLVGLIFAAAVYLILSRALIRVLLGIMILGNGVILLIFVSGRLTTAVPPIVPKGATAPQAAGVIHTDFERGFIKAEIVSFDDLISAGSMATAKSAGKVRMEGKDYVMTDGDVVEFRFNV